MIEKLTEEKNIYAERLSLYYNQINKSEKKISSLMGFAQHLVTIVKEKYLDSEKS